jgi:hypothetical protein
MSEKEKELFLNALESLGYRGFDGKRYHTEGTSYPSPEKLLKALLAQEYPDSIPSDIKFKLATIRMDKKYSLLYPLLKEVAAVSDKKAPESSTTGQDFSELYSKVTPYYDVGSRASSLVDAIYMIDEKNEQILTEIHPRSYLLSMGLRPEDIAANPKYHIRFVYEFKNTDFMYKAEYAGQMLTCINLCPRPYWLKMDVSPEIHPKIDRFLKHLFPLTKAREFVLDWLYWAITDRADTALVLTGKRGIGKDIFLSLVSALIGPEQVEKVTQAFFEDKFTGNMYQKRLLHADEVSLITLEAKNKLKRILNPLVSIEGKGQDAKTKVNSASLAITCNDTDLLGIEPDDRRYSVVEITETPLREAMSEEEMDDIAKGFLHLRGDYKDIVARFGHYIINRTPKYSRTMPYKEEYFYKITLDSLSNWKREIFDYLVIGYKGDGDPFKLSAAVRSGLKGVQRKSVTNFLESFYFMNKYKLGTAVYSEDDKTKDVFIQPNMKFVEYVRTLDLEKLGIKKTKTKKPDSPSQNKKVMTIEENEGDLL